MFPTAGMSVDTARSAALDGAIDGKLGALRGSTAGKAVDPAKVKKTAQDFETVFLEQMFNHMFSTVGVDSITGGGLGEETTRSLLVNAYAQTMTKAGGIGLAPSIANEILKIQEKADGLAR